jgi:hypothetical protein
MDRFDYRSLLSTNCEWLRNTAAEVRSLVVSFTPTAIKIGKMLALAKDEIPHGRFGDWCVKALNMDRRLVQLYMALAKAAEKYGYEIIEKLPLATAHLIAARATPDEVVSVVLDGVKSGDIPAAAVVKSMIRDKRLAKAEPVGAENEVKLLSDLLMDALDTDHLVRLKAFLADAPREAIRALCRNL